MFSSTPLACIQPSADSGNVLVLIDCNVFGETDSRPDRRTCPIPRDKIETLIRALVAARYGKEDPDKLVIGELYALLSAGKDRKRSLVKPLANPNMKKGRDANRLFTRVIHIHLKESSVRLRKKRTRGQVKLMQPVYLCANRETFMKTGYKDYPHHGGSIFTDILGPITMDHLSAIPTLTQDEKKQYWGKRFCLAGGACPSDDDDDLDEDDDAPPEEELGVPKYPINYHALPITVISDFVEGFNVKHVIDLTPTPLNLAFQLAQLGVSYVALCATEVMKDFLTKQTFNTVRRAICDENEPILFDPRFKDMHASQPHQGHIINI
jgi:hypothetical protein